MRGRIAFGAALAVAAILFTLLPSIDLWVSGLFWRAGDGFFLGQTLPARLIFRAVPLITYAVLAFALVVALAHLLGRRRLLGCDLRAAIYLVLALAIGPGYLTNTVLKDHWGRARPGQVTQFGGAGTFSPALVPSDQCPKNCSFVAGHPALAFFLVAPALLIGEPRRRRQAVAAALGFGALVGAVRIAQGGHFLSDVMFAGFLVFATSWLLHRLIMVGRWTPPPPSRRALAWTAATAAAIALGILVLDRPVAVYFHEADPGLRAVFQFITQFGLAKGWLIGAATVFAGLRAAALLPRLRGTASRLAAYSWLPLYFFAALAASGLAVDLVKILVGRTRPALLFRSGQYEFLGFVTHADRWSFPSGHTANAVAIALALSAMWPRLWPLGAAFALLIAASRIIITAHYLSDVVAGAALALLVTRYVGFVFAASGISLAKARQGELAPLPRAAWRTRLGLDRWRRAPLSDSP